MGKTRALAIASGSPRIIRALKRADQHAIRDCGLSTQSCVRLLRIHKLSPDQIVDLAGLHREVASEDSRLSVVRLAEFLQHFDDAADEDGVAELILDLHRFLRNMRNRKSRGQWANKRPVSLHLTMRWALGEAERLNAASLRELVDELHAETDPPNPDGHNPGGFDFD